MRCFVVDAFTDHPFGGNPAAVCLLEEERDPDWMQNVAAEFNLSETAFVTPERGLRWFTPTSEVDLCGHATLAAAHILWETGAAHKEPIHFQSKLYQLTCSLGADGIEMDFPAEVSSPCPVPAGLFEALGIESAHVERNRMDILVVLEDEAQLRSLDPNQHLLAQIEARGIIVTAAGGETDCVSRFFAPQVGVPEDPVCGSAHCCLGPYWSKRLSKEQLTGFQASHRGGVVRMRVQGDQVTLAGQATTVLSGELHA